MKTLLRWLGEMGQRESWKLFDDEDEPADGGATDDIDEPATPEPPVDSGEGEGESESASAGTENTEDGTLQQPIPYTRFKEVNDARKKLEGEKVELSTRLSTLEKQIAEMMKPADKGADEPFKDPKQKAYFEALKPFVAPLLKPVVDELNNWKKSTQEEKEKATLKNVEKQINTAIEDLAKQFPEMDKKMVYYEYISDSKSDLEKLAKESHTARKAERLKWLEDYRTGKVKDGKRQAANPGGVPPAMPRGDTKNLKTLSEKLEYAQKQAIKDMGENG